MHKAYMGYKKEPCLLPPARARLLGGDEWGELGLGALAHRHGSLSQAGRAPPRKGLVLKEGRGT